MNPPLSSEILNSSSTTSCSYDDDTNRPPHTGRCCSSSTKSFQLAPVCSVLCLASVWGLLTRVVQPSFSPVSFCCYFIGPGWINLSSVHLQNLKAFTLQAALQPACNQQAKANAQRPATARQQQIRRRCCRHHHYATP